jgi:hypothetical protein
MQQQVLAEKLNNKLKPLCPRDSHVMHYEEKGIEWKSEGQTHSVDSYHCDFEGCSVRFRLANGYFTVINMPDLPHFVEEPGTNILQCPRHGTWLYRSSEGNGSDHATWRCGVEGCDYTQVGDGGSWLRQ